MQRRVSVHAIRVGRYANSYKLIYDMDGTLVHYSQRWDWFKKHFGNWAYFLDQAISVFRRATPVFKKDRKHISIVITGRTKKDTWCTYLWFWLRGKFNVKIHFAPSRDLYKIAVWKRWMLWIYRPCIYINDDETETDFIIDPDLLWKEGILDDDVYVKMPPINKHAVKMHVKKIKKGEPSKDGYKKLQF